MAQLINEAPQTQAFLRRVASLPDVPGASLDSVLAPSVEEEKELRRLFAQDRQNALLANPYVGLVSVFDAPQSTGIRSTRARVVKDEDDRSAQYVFPLPDASRRKDGAPSTVESLDEFQRNWVVFTEGALSQLTDWSNVIAAGGSVLGCLLPMAQADKESRRTMRKYFHSSAYPTSDIDLFLWGLTPEQAEVKINQIYEAVRNSVPWDVTCVRTKHAISIHSQYPYRSVQIVLRLYHSPAEVLAGFDVDAPCVAYDGTHVLANPRSVTALMRQANTVDMTRRSPSYEVRLAKYAARGFEVHIPDLRRADVDPTIFERSLRRVTGLARLLVLEKLAKPEARVSYLESRRALRSRADNNTVYTRRMRRRLKSDLKADEEVAGLDMNDYDVAKLHVPYGPGWNAKRIEKLVYQTDLGMNSTFNPKNKGRRLHRHVAFFGTLKEVAEDECQYCPEPKDDTERALQEEEDKHLIRGRISFIEEDPGRQSMTGSFNPIDVGEWSTQAYLGPTEKLFAAIVASDRAAVQHFFTTGEVDVNRRDHVGRTPLHVAVLCAASDISADLVDAGARMTPRLADGRTALHLAAQMDMPELVEKMLTRSTLNAKNAKEAEEESKKRKAAAGDADETDVVDEENVAGENEGDLERPSSEDDWSSGESDAGEKKSKEKAKVSGQPDADADIPEDNAELPDVLDVNAPDWDLTFTPLGYAIVGGSLGTVQVLLNAGADAKRPMKATRYDAPVLHPLRLTVLQHDDERAAALAEQLLRAGASAAQANEQLFSVFHVLVCSGRTRLVEAVLRADPSAAVAINIPVLDNSKKAFYPLVTAITKGWYGIAALLLGYGAKVAYSPDDLQRAKNMVPGYGYRFNPDKKPHELDYLVDVLLPVESSLACHSYMAKLLIQLGGQVSVPIDRYFDYYDNFARRSLLDMVRSRVDDLKEMLATKEKEADLLFSENPKTFAELRKTIQGRLDAYKKTEEAEKDLRSEEENDSGKGMVKRTLSFFEEMKTLLEDVGAKSFVEIFADDPDAARPAESPANEEDLEDSDDRARYVFINKRRFGSEKVLPHLLDQYDALFEACWAGDNARIEELCLPRKGSKPEKPPIQIAVKTQVKMRRTGLMTFIDHAAEGVHTPLSVAILARKWDTAKLILAIATAQYKPKEETNEKRFNEQNFVLDADDSPDDSDANSCQSDDMDIDSGAQGIDSFTDLTARESAVQCNTSPELLMNTEVTRRLREDGKGVISKGSVVKQACNGGDLEAFVNIYEMMQLLPEAQEPDMSCILAALESDSSDLLDELIRRTGLGIDLGQLVEPSEEEHTEAKTSKFYLGLTVHGKKRKDLARRGDAHASKQSANTEIPLLWSAIRESAKKVVEYLSGSGPLVAYRYYSMTKSTERAEGLRKFQDLDKHLPMLLGVLPNARRETALTATILSRERKEKLSMAKRILSLFPTQASNLLHSTLAFSGMTPLHLAATENLESEFFDFLISNGLSVETSDRYGMNVYHIVCFLGHTELLEYFLKSLPRDVTTHLLTQTTRRRRETPLMLAVQENKQDVVELLLRSGIDAVNDCLITRDVQGSMPLHAAVRKGFAKIALALMSASAGSGALHSENGVGETPIETACIQWLLHSTRIDYDLINITGHGYGFNGYANLDTHEVETKPGPPDADKLVTEVKLLYEVRAHLQRNKKFVANAKLKDALDAFIIYLSQKRDAPQEPLEKPSSSDADECDRAKTFEIVRTAVLASPGQRRLVHLIDVQRSVSSSLEKATGKSRNLNEGDEYAQRWRFSIAKELPDEADAEASLEEEQWKGILSSSENYRALFNHNTIN
ncbi:ankyrin repeat protein [Phellopilus nigrolimitatus]|nr:ankyrin repeat protein [Phellopilus nigrolimitatus]